MGDSNSHKPAVGWREWVALPSLNVAQLKAKIDTGAKTSALHAWYVEPFERDDRLWVKFGLHPEQDNTVDTVECEAPVHDQRTVTDSGGHAEERYVILTEIVIGGSRFETEVTLTNRDNMRFRMLVGRNTLNNRFVVDPVQSYLLGDTPNELKQGESNEDRDTVEE